MKKVYSSKRYNKWKHSAAAKGLRAKDLRVLQNLKYKQGLSVMNRSGKMLIIPAPKDFRLADNPDDCIEFFQIMRDVRNYNYRHGMRIVRLGLQKIEKIDYCSVSVLKALLNDLKAQKIQVQGDNPDDPNIKRFLTDSGFYDGLLDANDKVMHIKGDADRLSFTKGRGKLDEEDPGLVGVLKRIRKHLTSQNGHCPQLRTIVLEICGNSIEHSHSYNKQWMLGVKYDKNLVIITIVDTGRGILKTLYRRLGRQFVEFFHKSHVDILKGAFEKKYGSATRDENRNKGLPVVQKRFTEGYIKNLVVLTNNVYVNFSDPEKSKKLSKGLTFDGTIFKLELDKSCFHANYNSN